MAQTVILRGPQQRDLARRMVEAAPPNTVLTLQAEEQTDVQRKRMWAMLSDVARARPRGRVAPPEAWKVIFLGALGHETKWLDGLEPGYPSVPWEGSSRRLSKREMSDLISLIRAFGDQNGVRWSEPHPDEAAA